jgi:hypothetical protein
MAHPRGYRTRVGWSKPSGESCRARVRDLGDPARLGAGEPVADKSKFPALSLEDASRAFTKAGYGGELTFEHA